MMCGCFVSVTMICKHVTIVVRPKYLLPVINSICLQLSQITQETIVIMQSIMEL